MNADTRIAWWRLHAITALLCTPFLLWAALTGLGFMLMADATPTTAHPPMPAGHAPAAPALSFVQRLHAASKLAHPAHEGKAPASANAASVHAAPMHAGHAHLARVRLPAREDEPLFVWLQAGDGTQEAGALRPVSVDAQGRVTQGPPPAGALDWARRWHSRSGLGDGGRWVAEWAATGLLVLLASGLVLAWPRRGATPRAAPCRRLPLRLWLRRVHIGVALGALLVSTVMVGTGLAWSQLAGQRVLALRDTLGHAPAQAAVRDAAARGTHGTAPSSSAPTPRVEPPPTGATPLTLDDTSASWQAVHQLVRSQAPGQAVVIEPHLEAQAGVPAPWRVVSDERGRPLDAFEWAVDPAGAQILSRVGWAEQPALVKAAWLFLPFHRGEYGLWNQLLLALFALTVAASVVTGWWMWWRRPRHNALGLPPMPAARPGAPPTEPLVPMVPALTLGLLVSPLLPWMLFWACAVLAIEWASREPQRSRRKNAPSRRKRHEPGNAGRGLAPLQASGQA
jgi:uncharacterized iron-regulated membrane protein